jgi:hypothetical protein
LGKVEEITERLNNMCNVVGDIISYMGRWLDMVALGVVMKNLVTMLDLG